MASARTRKIARSPNTGAICNGEIVAAVVPAVFEADPMSSESIPASRLLQRLIRHNTKQIFGRRVRVSAECDIRIAADLLNHLGGEREHLGRKLEAQCL